MKPLFLALAAAVLFLSVHTLALLFTMVSAVLVGYVTFRFARGYLQGRTIEHG